MLNLSIDRIGRAMEKIALDLSLFRISYESETTRKSITESFKSTTSLGDKIDKTEPFVQKNIDEWRDYIHKYSLILISISGFFLAIIQFSKPQTNLTATIPGFILIGISLVLTFITIFSTIFLQKKIIDGNFAFGIWCHHPNDKHPDELHWSDAVRRNLKENIEKQKQELKQNQFNKKEKRLRKLQLKADTKALRSMKYTGGTYLWLDNVRVFLTIFIITTSLTGIFLLTKATLFQGDSNNQKEPLSQETLSTEKEIELKVQRKERSQSQNQEV